MPWAIFTTFNSFTSPSSLAVPLIVKFPDSSPRIDSPDSGERIVIEGGFVSLILKYLVTVLPFTEFISVTSITALFRSAFIATPA